jgi:hypothetical protein
VSPLTDSAGVPWEGREFHANPSAGDDGAADPALVASIERFRAGEASAIEVVAALTAARLLVPLVTEAGDEGVGPFGQRVDKTQELALVTVSGPDGRPVLPVFSSVATMASWNPSARPIPVSAPRAALAAAADGVAALVLDPGAPTEFAVRRTAFEAVATAAPWVPAWLDDGVRAAVEAGVAGEAVVTEIALESGDPEARLRGPEVRVALRLAPGLYRATLDVLLARIAERWASTGVLATRVDALGIRVH